jgi:uncharacterized membrane-anchored protein YjiN (DUF445 family)
MRLLLVTLLACVAVATANPMQQIFDQLNQQALANAPAILAQLNAQLAKFPANSQISIHIQSMINQIQNFIDSHNANARFIGPLTDKIVGLLENVFGLTEVKQQLATLTGGIKDSFFGTLETLATAGSVAWGKSLIVFKQLVDDLKGHSIDAAASIVPKYIEQIKQIIASKYLF